MELMMGLSSLVSKVFRNPETLEKLVRMGPHGMVLLESSSSAAMDNPAQEGS